MPWLLPIVPPLLNPAISGSISIKVAPAAAAAPAPRAAAGGGGAQMLGNPEPGTGARQNSAGGEGHRGKEMPAQALFFSTWDGDGRGMNC